MVSEIDYYFFEIPSQIFESLHSVYISQKIFKFRINEKRRITNSKRACSIRKIPKIYSFVYYR